MARRDAPASCSCLVVACCALSCGAAQPASEPSPGASAAGSPGASAAPNGEILETRLTGGLDREAVQDVIREADARFRHCFERLLRTVPDAVEGRVAISFRIERWGQVQQAEVVGPPGADGQFAECVRGMVERLVFPPSEAPTLVTYPFAFQTTGGGE
jgi:hypothetical protein